MLGTGALAWLQGSQACFNWSSGTNRSGEQALTSVGLAVTTPAWAAGLTDMLEQAYRDYRSGKEDAWLPELQGDMGHAQQQAPSSTALVVQASGDPPAHSRLPPVMRAAALRSLKQRQVGQ